MSEWKEYRLKDLGFIGSGTTPKSDKDEYYDNGTHPWLNTGCVQDCMITKPAKYLTDLALQDCSGLRYFPENTLIVAMYGGGTIGNVGLTTFPTTINQACCALSPNKMFVDPKFLFYLLQSQKGWMVSHGFGGTQINLSQGQISNFIFSFPELTKQKQIADYLDDHIESIGKQESLLTNKRDCYSRLKTSIINRAVTRGLNPDVSFKDSGIEWIGKIPEHWKTRRLKDLAYLYSGLTGKSGDDFRCDDETKTKPFIPFTNILNNTKIDVSNVNYVVMDEGEDQNMVCQNDLLFLMSSEDYESIAKSAVVVQEPGELYLNSFCRGLHFTSEGVYSPFVNYQLSASNYRDALRLEARGFTRINIKVDRIASMFVSLPPLSEQQAISTYLDDKCAKIDAAIANIDKQIDALKRLKRALINEVVTGKREI